MITIKSKRKPLKQLAGLPASLLKRYFEPQIQRTLVQASKITTLFNVVKNLLFCLVLPHTLARVQPHIPGAPYPTRFE